MHSVYNILLLIYLFLVRVASVFNKKACAWIDGRKGWKENLAEKVTGLHGREIIWFHCASLGEFEQGRPLIEELRQNKPGCSIILSFFSPSGYTVRKNYQHADAGVYLPLDTPANARFWLETVKPAMAFFIKYEYWFNFLKELKLRRIPVVFASAVFRKEQLFFQWYGSWFRSQLENISWFYVQNESSGQILQSLGFDNVTISGDTRFDRVSATVENATSFPIVEQFCGNCQVVSGGSTWEEDEALLFPFIRANKGKLKFILATHDVSQSRIRSLETSLGVPFIRYSALNMENAGSADVLIIDTVGILSQLYRYARLAFIGGAFGSGLHNILEAVAFGVPVFFGPKHERFWEAAALIKAGGAYSVSRYEEFSDRALRLLSDEAEYNRTSKICSDFVQSNRGATSIILNGMKDVLSAAGKNIENT
jgi:3-deoxy-D-manno-octulosonic-acid transferase